MRLILGYEAGLQPNGGIGRYARGLRRALRGAPQIGSITCMANLSVLDAASLEEREGQWGAHAAIRPATPWTPERVARAVGSRIPLLNTQLRDLRARQLLDSGAYDLYHELNYTLRASSLPSVASIHDLSTFSNPGSHPARRVAEMGRAIPHAVDRAQALITISEFSRREIVQRYPQAEGKLFVVPVGVEPGFSPRTEVECMPVLHAQGLAWKNFVLFVGTLEPRKNLERCLQAYADLPLQQARALPLVVVGAKGWRDGSLNAALDAACERGIARKVGSLADDELPMFYSAARGLCFASLYEGQGLPALEATCCGTPVLTTIGSPMAENLSGIALTADPTDARAIRDGLLQLIEDDGLQANAMAHAASIAAAFAWDKIAVDTLKVYEFALASAGRPRSVIGGHRG